MKKILFFCTALLLMAACSGGSQEENDKLQVTNDSLRAQLNSRDNEMDSVLSLFNMIQEGFSQINQAQNRVTLSRTGSGEARQAAREQIQSDMQFIINTMKENQQRIADLQARMKKSNLQSSELQKAIEGMQSELEMKNKQLEALQTELAQRSIVIEGMDQSINELNANIEELAIQNQTKDQVVATQDKNLHTAWFAIGTRSELKNKRILINNEVLTGNYDKDYFTQVDIRSLNTIALMSKKGELLTNHPSGSYELVKGTDNMLTLKIINPTNFWSISKYLVIRVW